MTYRKFKADYLFTGEDIRGEDAVLVTSTEGTVQDVIPAAAAGDDVETYSGILSPGFVNCHCHLELSHMKGLLPERTGLVDFLTAVIKRRGEANAAGTLTGVGSSGNGAKAIIAHAERVRLAMTSAEQEMLDNGIVAVGDICNTADSLFLKTEGRLYYHNFIETMGFIEQGAAGRFAHSLDVFKAFAEAYSLPIEANSIVPHAPYSVSGALFGMVAGFPGNHVLTIHNQESEEENTFYLSGKGDFLRLYEQLGLDVSFFRGTGKRSLASYLPHFYRNQSLILVHNVATSQEDLQAAMAARPGRVVATPDNGATSPESKGAGGPNLFFCLCPNANLYIGGRLPDVNMLVRNGGTIVVGTDSLASNHQLSILDEIKTLQQAFPELTTPQLLQWATSNGARALQLDGMLGSFSPGKRPGILLIGDLEGQRLKAGTSVRRLL